MFSFRKIQTVRYIVVAGILVSCSNVKYLPKGEKLYTGAKVTVNTSSDKPKGKDKKALEKELQGLTRPKPNTTMFFGLLRPRLWFYNIAGKPTGKGLRYFLKNKLGEPPVVFSSVDPQKNRDILRNRLENRGYFHADVYYKIIDKKNRHVSIDYIANVDAPYTIQKIFLPEGDSLVPKLIRKHSDSSLIKPGMVYDLDVLKKERERLDNALKDEGIFYFNADYILFQVDSTIGNKKIILYEKVKEQTPVKAKRIYHLNKVYIVPGRTFLGIDSFSRKQDTLENNGYYFVGLQKRFRPHALLKNIFLVPGDKYTHHNFDLTLNRLMNMGTFKFVNIRFFDLDSLGEPWKLNSVVYLTPMPKQSVRAELKLISKSNDFAGPALTLSWRNRNLFKGGEMLKIDLNSSYETLLSGKESGLNSYTIGAQSELQLPRFLAPFHVKDYKSRYVPKTIFGLGFQHLSRVNYYGLNTFNASAGYRWNETERKQHELFPVNINYIQLVDTTNRFVSLLKNNFSLRRSFQTQFIIGSTYSYTYNTQVSGQRTHDFYFNGTADVSGNTIYLLQSLVKKAKPTVDTPFTIFGRPYSQYSRITLDGRYFFNIDPHNKIAARLFTGVGYPYGNSSVLPYTKQFFAGGNNSVRAFAPRTLGPGTYRSPESDQKGFFADESGDMKLESNLEYRFDIIGVFKGALFTDAGNVWLVRKDPQRPGGEFKYSTFMKEMGVGTGVGLRIDVSFFVLRFDLAMPLRKPYLPEGQRWVINDINFHDNHWRRDNLILNIAIGYPF